MGMKWEEEYDQNKFYEILKEFQESEFSSKTDIISE